MSRCHMLYAVYDKTWYSRALHSAWHDEYGGRVRTTLAPNIVCRAGQVEKQKRKWRHLLRRGWTLTTTWKEGYLSQQ